MKNLIKILCVVAFAASMFALVGFTSSSGYQYGRQDKEYTMAVVAGGVTVTAGQWVWLAMSDTQSLDTAAVVSNVSLGENSAPMGVAEMGGQGGTMIRILTRGYHSAVYVNGIDSGTAAGILNGTILAGGYRAGTAGAASTYMTANAAADADISAAQAAATFPCGISLGTVATTDTGAAYTHPVYVTCR